MARRSARSVSSSGAGSVAHRAVISARVRGPRSASRSWRSSAWRACRVGTRRCSSISSAASAAGSRSSRSSSAPMRSRNRSRSSASAAARRSASGASPSYMYDRDPAEQQRLRERRRAPRLDGHDAQLARADVAEHLAQRGDVEDVADTLARGLEQHRERRVGGGHVEQVGRPLALLPERCAFTRPPPAVSATRAPRSRGTSMRTTKSPAGARPRDRRAPRPAGGEARSRRRRALRGGAR